MARHLQDQHFSDEPAPVYAPPPVVPPTHNSNPLAKYFRIPGVHVKLPTAGAFMPPGSVDFGMNGEVAVYPMRAADELLLKSPDALMNGFAIEKLIESCVPAIKAPRLISSPDLDVLLMAIRAATISEIITLTPTCPSCEAQNETQRNLGSLLANMTFVEPENAVRLSDDVIVYVRPHNLTNATKLGITAFEESRKVQAVTGDDVPEAQRAQQISQSMQRLTELHTETLADCIVKVVVPEGAVTDKRLVREFIGNISKTWTDKISNMLESINKLGIAKHFDITCASCGHEWQSDIEFNPSTFFDNAS